MSSQDAYDSKVQRKLRPSDGSLDVLAGRIDELRHLMKREFAENADLYDKRDIDRFMDLRDDWYCRRWIIYQRHVETAFQMCKEAFQWRKQIGLNELSYEDFPLEFYECGCVVEYGRDKKGRRVLYVRCKLFRPMQELNELYDKFFAFMFDQCDKRSKAIGFTMMYDVTDTGLSNVEMSTLRFMAGLRDKFPFSSRQILIAGLPWVLTPVFKLITGLIPASHAAAIKSINLEDLNEYIDECQVPAVLGGTSKTKFQVVPRKCKPAEEFPEFSESLVEKLQKHVAQYTSPDEYEYVESLRVIR